MADAGVPTASSVTDLEALVHSHSLFFDKLVDLIPAKFYLPADDNVEKPWVGGMNKRQKAQARKLTKQNLKKARRDRLDPKTFATTSQLLKQREQETGEDDVVEIGTEEVDREVDRARSDQELRARLHKRIEAIRAQRHADGAAAKAKSARDWQKEAKKASKKRKNNAQDEAVQPRSPVLPKPVNKRQKHGTGENVHTDIKMEFGRVKIDSQKNQTPNRKQTKEKLLQQATKLQSDMQDPEKGKEVAAKHSWDAAVSRAAGEKVFDNPKLLKQSLKRDHQRREKSAQKWQGRQELEKQKAEEKQQSRATHIKERIDARKERLITKREKKLMRPGFEGRKAGFINQLK